MKKFEEKLRTLKEKTLKLDWSPGIRFWYDLSTLVNVFGDWVSPEDHQAEIDQLKSQLENQQSEIPGFVAEFVSGDENALSKADRIAYLLKSVEGDNYYLEEYLTNAGIISQEHGERLYAWATKQTHEIILKLWNGYTVAKEKRFYLKNKLTGAYLRSVDGCMTETFISQLKTLFTQQEIDSMETGSYEQIEVEEKA